MRAATDVPTGQRTTDRLAEVHTRLVAATGVALPLRLWDGSELGDPDAAFRVVLHHPWSLRAMLLPPSDLAAAEAYLDGDIDIEGDIVAAMAAGATIAEAPLGPSDKLAVLRALLATPAPPKRPRSRRARLRGRLHSKERDRAAVQFHYDLPQGFYEAFLDSRLVYSCAYFADPAQDLEVAQLRKLDLICRKLRLRPGQRLLDVGCGWGSLLCHAAAHYGVEAVGVTLSTTQAEAGGGRVAAAGLSDRVEIRLADYRDLDETFDAVASVGMVEHVGADHLPEYFAAVYRLVRPGGLFCNHGIVTGFPERVSSLRAGRTFIGAYVFPDGALVPAWQMIRDMQRPGFEVLDVEQLRPHYALTLRHWVARLEANHDAAVAAASETDYRIWRLYMAGSAVSFERRRFGVVQVLGVKPGGRPELPLGREWMTPG